MSDDFTIRTDDLKRLERRFENASRNEVTGAIHQMLRKIGRFMVPAMRKEQPTGATGRLKRATTFTIEGTRDLRLLILDGQRYGRFVRSGTRPHWPPKGALRGWVIKKFGVSGKAADRAEYFVRRKISRVGTKANPYHVRAVEAKRSEIATAAAELGGQIVVTLAGKD